MIDPDPTPRGQAVAPMLEIWTSPLGRRYVVGPFGSRPLAATA